MKNAYVIEHHFGDDGDTPAGSILMDVGTKRFEELEKKNLVREATDAEVKAGYTPKIDADETPSETGEGEKKKPEPANKKAAEPANKGA